MVCRVLRILTLIYCHIEVEVIVKSRPYFAHIGWIVFIHFPCEQGQFLNKKTGYNTCLENKLILISIKFTPKTSHSCPKNWYFPRVSRCQPNKNVSTKDQTKKTSANRLVVASKDVIFRNQGYILLMDLGHLSAKPWLVYIDFVMDCLQHVTLQ